jgi:hypothetical protein
LQRAFRVDAALLTFCKSIAELGVEDGARIIAIGLVENRQVPDNPWLNSRKGSAISADRAASAVRVSSVWHGLGFSVVHTLV